LRFLVFCSFLFTLLSETDYKEPEVKYLDMNNSLYNYVIRVK